MGPADALSQKDNIETSDDNREITLLKGKDQYFHIQTIDAALVKKISSSLTKDPIITKALAAMNHTAANPGSPELWQRIGNSLITPYISNTASMSLNLLAMTW